MKALFAIATILFLAGQGFTARADLVNGVKAIVHDSIVTYQQVFDSVILLMPELNARYWNDPETLARERNRLLDENTETLIERELILHEFETAGFQVPDSIVDDYVQDYIRERYNGSRAIMAKSLQAEGLTFEKYRRQIRDRIILNQMRLKNVSDALMISPHKIEVYYVTHTNDFKVEDQVKLRMIALNKPADDAGQIRKLAEEILAKIEGGATFEEMASVYSQDSKRSQGGSWDWERTAVLRSEFSSAAAVLQPGERSGVIETPEACYLMMLEDRKQAHIRPLNDVRQEIENILLREERQRLQDKWIQRLRKKTFVRYF